MTLRRLLDQPRAASQRTSSGAAQPRTAIAFAFDSAYIDAFRVMTHSLARSGTLLDCPVYVYSDDPQTLDNDVVRRVADRRHLVEGRDLDELVEIAERHVRRSERAAWNRGTCLKWSIFDDAAVDQVLFLDVDMICLRPLEGFLSLHPEADIVCCPQFQRTMMPEGDGPNVRLERRSRLVELLEGRGRLAGRINSGVMLVRKKLLDRRFRNELLAFASQRVAVNEQSHLTDFFRRPEGRAAYTLKMASSAYNFHENYLQGIDPIDALSLLRRVRVLHFAGSPKPWTQKAAKIDRPSLQLWRQFQKSADMDGLPED